MVSGMEGREMIVKITKAIIRHYSDNQQTRAYVEWIDERGEGRTEGAPLNHHMQALLRRADREGVKLEMQLW
jgi:hypothetical protein